MKKQLFMITSFILLIAVCHGISWGQVPARPQIVIEKNTYNAREVREGTPIEHTFLIHNRGNAVLMIKKVKPT